VFSLLKGPTGSCKSTTIKVIAGELGVNLKEWITPANNNSYYEDFDGKISSTFCILKLSDTFPREEKI
jgi:Holliday junction resolvasome RuvABC ATP-dependent DNA helicase subunit